MRQLTSLDAQFLAMETPPTFGHVAGIAILDPSTAPGGNITADSLCDLLAERIHMVPPFRWRLAPVPFGLDHPYWIEDSDFDLEYHIRELALPAPGNAEQLAEQVARICARPLDRSHPLWELYVIHGIEGGRTGILTKVHHAAVDGMSGAEIMSILYDLEPEGRVVEPPPEGKFGERPPSQLELLGRAVMGLPRPLKSLAMIPATLPRLD